MRKKLLTGALIAVTTMLTACQTLTTSRQVAVSANEEWVILPFENLSQTPQAGDRAKSFAETHLRSQGVRNVHVYETDSQQNILTLLDESGQIERARQWAKENGYVYGVTGTVQEWQYKNGLDNEPSVSVTLKFLQLQQDEVMWVASSTRTGWGYENLSGIGSKAIAALIDEVHFKQPRKVTRIVKRIDPNPEPVKAAAMPVPEPRIQPATTPSVLPAPVNAPMDGVQQNTVPEPIPGAALPTPIYPQPVTTSNNVLPVSPYQTSLGGATNR